MVKLAPPNTNVLANPEFAGGGGPSVGAVTELNEVPDNWRAFGVQGGEVEFEAVALEVGEVFPDSPAARSACINVTTFGNHGFDHDSPGNGADHFPLIANVEYHAEFWVKTSNADESDQAFTEALSDDLNVSQSLAAVFGLVSEVNRSRPTEASA